MTVSQPPAWPPASCPAWCCRDHRPEDHPEDRIHEAEPLALTADVRSSLLPEHVPEPIELQVQMRQRATEPDPWIEVHGDEPGRFALTLSVASARRLAATLHAASSIT